MQVNRSLCVMGLFDIVVWFDGDGFYVCVLILVQVSVVFFSDQFYVLYRYIFFMLSKLD